MNVSCRKSKIEQRQVDLLEGDIDPISAETKGVYQIVDRKRTICELFIIVVTILIF